MTEPSEIKREWSDLVADVSVKCMVKGIVNRKSIICASTYIYIYTCVSTDMGMKLAWKLMWKLGCSPPSPCGCPNCHI